MWQDPVSLYLLSRVNQGDWPLFEKLKGNCSLKIKKKQMRVIRENSCMLKEAATASYSWKNVFFIFINIEIVGKLKYINGLHPVSSLKSEFLHSYLLFLFLAGTSRSSLLEVLFKKNVFKNSLIFTGKYLWIFCGCFLTFILRNTW